MGNDRTVIAHGPQLTSGFISPPPLCDILWRVRYLGSVARANLPIVRLLKRLQRARLSSETHEAFN